MVVPGSNAHSKCPITSSVSRTLKPPGEIAVGEQMTTSQLLQLLGIQQLDPGAKPCCHGRGAKRSDCGNLLSAQSQRQIVSNTQQLAYNWCLSSTSLQLLAELAGLIMCRRSHQDQAAAKFDIWKSKLPAESATQQLTRSTPHTPQHQVNSNDDTHVGMSASYASTRSSSCSPLWSVSQRPRGTFSNTITPCSSIHRDGGQVASQGASQAQPLQSIGCPAKPNGVRSDIVKPGQTFPALLTPLLRSTRSMTSAKDSPSTTKSAACVFEPMYARQSFQEAANDLLGKLKSNLSPFEFKDGLIYGYRRPNCNLIKIGYSTKPVQQRMHDIEIKCNYTPKIIFQTATKYAMRVERLVHKYLHEERRRECLRGGLCNDGNGCTVRHHEWFEGVSDERAQSVVQIWVDWIQLRPYDEKGNLKPVWNEKILNIKSGGDIWMIWTKIKIPVTQVKEE